MEVSVKTEKAASDLGPPPFFLVSFSRLSLFCNKAKFSNAVS